MTQATPFSGYHHITNSVTNPQPDVDFHTKVLGLRLIKRTVLLDGDAPFYHLYYGKGLGVEGSLLTSFVITHRPLGRIGAGQITSIGLSVPEDSLDYWEKRLTEFGVPHSARQRFDSKRIRFSHPDGIVYEFIGVPIDGEQTWPGSPVPAEASIQGIHSVEVSAKEVEQFDLFLGTAMGLTAAGQDGAESRYSIAADAPGNLVEVVHTPELAQGSWGYERNTIDHVAFNVGNADAQQSFKAHLESMGFIDASEPKDRNYFSSVYFRTPAGAMFEACWTHEGGFLKDETPEEIGTSLQLPPWQADRHDEILAQLEPITV